MTEGIIVAIITGGLAFLGTALTVTLQTSKTQYRIDQLEKKVEKHNNLIDRTYHLEEEQAVIEEKIKVANKRLNSLEGK